ncbi:3-methyl-2-oxobutanoate hydroxymethyltransferase [Gossypium australe]|uniref:3-methyl-2-oxobutanoate hydroxymethyltransferase n=1 Tax=Gossypium australe TaxID=47621 RepID=A0A5B6UI95_9ROSI|nr:3-methyl-2-oxobutanoate hydroxymethyltransferase [Gossypium australe]
MQVQSLIRRNEESTGRANSLKLPSACSWLVEYMADFNGETSNKDKRYRKRAKECHELQADLICMILDGDDKYRTTRRWEDKQVIVVEAMNRLRDPHLLQQWLRKLQSGIVENPIQALQKEMEVQGEAIEDQTEQLISEAKDFRMVAEVLNKVWTSYVAKQQLTDPVSIQDLVQTDDESFIFHFPLTPDCSRCAKIRINLQDLSSLGFFDVEKHDLENHLPDFAHQYPGEGSSDARANQENMKLSYENISTVQGHADFQNILTNSLTEADHNIESKPERFELKDITNREDLSSLGFFDVEKYYLENRHLPDFGLQYPGEGSSDAKANQENMKLSYENTSPVQGHAYFQNILANSLTEADHSIKSKPERLELNDVTNIEILDINIRVKAAVMPKRIKRI